MYLSQWFVWIADKTAETTYLNQSTTWLECPPWRHDWHQVNQLLKGFTLRTFDGFSAFGSVNHWHEETHLKETCILFWEKIIRHALISDDLSIFFRLSQYIAVFHYWEHPQYGMYIIIVNICRVKFIEIHILVLIHCDKGDASLPSSHFLYHHKVLPHCLGECFVMI